MSSISQLKQQVNVVGEQAIKTSGQLSQLAQNLETQVGQINSQIGGTASGEDKTMMSSFQQASKAIKEAASALASAGKSAKDWAAKA